MPKKIKLRQFSSILGQRQPLDTLQPVTIESFISRGELLFSLCSKRGQML